MKKSATIFFFFIILLFGAFPLSGQKNILITDFGGEPDSRKNVVPAIRDAVASCSGEEKTTLQFPKGRYDFWPSDGQDNVTIGFLLQKEKNILIEGNGSAFIFHSRMQIALIDSCENIELRNFSVDWERPYISQAEIMEATDRYLEVKIDKSMYPFVIENNRILFTGEGWKSPVINAYNNLYDKNTKEIVSQTWDNPLGNIFEQQAEERMPGVVRFWGDLKIKPEAGSFVSLFHARYLTNGIQIRYSKNTLLKNLDIYHALSHGVLGEMSENITMDHASMKVNTDKGRVFSIVADASHFVNCKGTIKVEHCAHTGQGDDFINVHGRNVKIVRVIDHRTIEVKNDGRYTSPGDELWFINYETVQRGAVGVVESVRSAQEGNNKDGFQIRFTASMPSDVKEGDFVENKTWTASLELRDCKILKQHRARGILVTTPKEVIIENNYFRTAGTAILIEGDMDHWFESGAVKDVKIRNNVFEDCLSSGNREGDRWQWGDAVITITPSHRPVDAKTKPYHQNIMLQDNIFKVFDIPLVRARSVDGLYFIHNEISQTHSYPPFLWQKASFLLDGCRNVVIKENKIDPSYKERSVRIEHMSRKDIKSGQGFNIDFVKGIKTYLN